MLEVRSSGRAALSQTCFLWLMPGQAIYAGPSLNPGLHSGSVTCFAVGIDGPFVVRTEKGAHSVRSALVPPRLAHEVVAPETRMVFYYLDAGSARECGCRARMSGGAEIPHGHLDEAELLSWPDSRWRDIAAPVAPVRVDPRITAAAATIRARPTEQTTAAELACQAGVSTSRFLHLFRQETGTSLRRYRLWSQMLAVATAIAAQRDLTTAAVDTGFASASHFSTTFRRMFGLPPSLLFRAGVTIQVVN